MLLYDKFNFSFEEQQSFYSHLVSAQLQLITLPNQVCFSIHLEVQPKQYQGRDCPILY